MRVIKTQAVAHALLVLSLVLWAALLLACRPQENSVTAGPGSSVYRHSMDGAPTSLDPIHASSIYANFLAVNLYDTLYRYRYLARPYELTPNLAESLPEVSADGLIYTIRIKPDVYFVDDPAFPEGKGRLLRAEDFIYSMKRHFDPDLRSQGSWMWQGKIVGLDEWKAAGANYAADIPGLKALDDRTVQIQLVTPFPQLPHTLAQGYAAVVPEEAASHYGNEFGVHPVGSGPFRLQSFDSTRAVLLRNPQFRSEPFNLTSEGYDVESQQAFGLEALEGQSPPFVDRVEVEFIAEDAARWNTFNSGLLDFIKVPVTQFDQVLAERDPPQLVEEMANKYHLLANLESGFVHTDFNMDDQRIGHHPDPEQDARNRALRCAIVKAFDWPRRNEIFYSGLGQVFPGVIAPITPEFDSSQSLEPVTRNLDEARSLLKRNGWSASNLPVLEYGFASSVTERQMFEQFRSFMQDLGYPEDKIKPLTFASYGDYARAYLNREVMLVTTAWTMDYPDSENTMQLYFGPNASPGANNANYRNPEYDRLYREAAVMPESPARTALYRKMSQMVIDDCVSISGLSRTLILLWDKRMQMLPDRSFVGGYFLRFASTGAVATGEN
ncbi:MAG TPA: ABC transporter substrate-binding protein [Xanthomonadales bacterium]|nr:ABC transporter substrate-binding protein [Xanthomonadales bacterium]